MAQKALAEYVAVGNWEQAKMARKWRAVTGAAALGICLASPAYAQVDPAKCRALILSSDERIAACTMVIEAGTGPKEGLAWAYRIRGSEYLKNRDFDRAVADYSQVVQLYPQDRNAYICRGEANRYKRDFDQAIADYTQAIDIDPNDGLAYVNRAVAYSQKDDFGHAFVDYARAIELNPRDERAYLNRGISYKSSGDIDSAIADFDQAIEISSTFRTHRNAYLQRGGAYAAKGEFDRAIADYDEGIQLDPKDARAYRMRGLVNLQAGSLQKSLADFDQSQELDPKDLYTALWREIVARRSAKPSHLAEAMAKLDMTKWPAAIVRLFLGETTSEAVLAVAENSAPLLQKDRVCEANFYAGELARQHGSKEDAARLFGLAASDCPKDFIEWRSAKAELKALGVNP